MRRELENTKYRGKDKKGRYGGNYDDEVEALTRNGMRKKRKRVNMTTVKDRKKRNHDGGRKSRKTEK